MGGKRKAMEYSEVILHFGEDLSTEALRYIDNIAMLDSRYIFTSRVGKKQFGYCSHCHARFESCMRHGSMEDCPACGSRCMVRASGISRKWLFDQALVVWYEKSLINPEAITCRTVWCIRDYRDDYQNVETQTVTVGACVFRPGMSAMVKRNFRFNVWRRGYGSSNYYPEGPIITDWYRAATPHPINDPNMLKYVSLQSVQRAVEGTQFRYSCWEEYRAHEDMVRFFTLFSAAPCVEYLTKLRLKELVLDKLNGYRTYGAVNWKGRTPESVLRITKQQFREIMKSGVHVSFCFLYVLHLGAGDGSIFTPAEAEKVAEHGPYMPQFADLAKSAGVNLRRVVAYAERQRCLEEDGHRYSGIYDVLRTWEDYRKDCRNLRMDFADEAVSMPRSLHRSHQNMIAQIKIEANRELEARMKEYRKKLDGYAFRAFGLLAVPAHTPQELIDEGRALNHCVGGYAERVAKGQCVILFIRKQADPSTPFYTAEIRDGQIFQCRGKRNSDMTPEVMKFMEAFKRKKLDARKQKKTAIAI